jgi:hypothetical protein
MRIVDNTQNHTFADLSVGTVFKSKVSSAVYMKTNCTTEQDTNAVDLENGVKTRFKPTILIDVVHNAKLIIE